VTCPRDLLLNESFTAAASSLMWSLRRQPTLGMSPGLTELESLEMDLIALLLFLGLAVTAFAWLAFADRV
jgi:hypothetical protein